MSDYKLYYFNVRAKGEVDRWSLAAAKINFEDMRLSDEEWAKEKASGRPPLGQVPFLVTPDGKILAQSGAILKYICREAGLSPTDSFDQAVADMIHDGVTDLRNAVIKAHFEKDEEIKAELRKEFFGTTLPARLKQYEDILKKRNDGNAFFLGEKLTYADISFVEFFNGLLNEGKATVPDSLKDFPLLMAHYERVINVPEIKAWIEKRPKTDF